MPNNNPCTTEDDECLITSADLPLSCPQPSTELWNMHPRVYLPIEKTGRATCPYCGAKFKLIETDA